MAGFFVALEGPEGAGKSTQARLLGQRLGAAGHRVVLTREPGGTPIGEQVRAVLLDHANCAMLPATEALLYSAARAQHVGEVVRPALAGGAIVVCDRFVDSTLAYQGGGRGLGEAELRAVQRLATDGLLPDLRVLLDLPVAVGLARRFAASEPVNRLDAAELAFHERVRAFYRALVAAEPAAWVVVDATRAIDEVAAVVAAEVVRRLAERPPADGPRDRGAEPGRGGTTT